MFLVALPIIIPWYKSLGLTMAQVYQINSIFSFSALILEVPSGYISDLLGRKKTLVFACFFHALAFSFYPFATSFLHFALLNVVLAIGLSLFSGTDVALLYDSMELLDDVGARAKIMGNKVFSTQMGETAASLVCMGLVTISLTTPIYVNAVLAWFPFLVALSITEPPRQLMEKSNHRDNWKHIYRTLFKQSRLLGLVILNTIFYGVATLIAVWAFQAYWTRLGIDIKLFGALWAVSNLSVALVARKAHALELVFGGAPLLIVMGLLPIVGYLGMGMVGLWWGIFFGLAFQVARGLAMVVLRDAINKRVGAEMRATANSISSLGVRLCFVFLGPAMGWLMDNKGQALAFQSFGFAYIVVFLVILLPLIAERKNFRTT